MSENLVYDDDWLNAIVGSYDSTVLDAYYESGTDLPRLGIAGKLADAFLGSRIYLDDDVSQGLTEPCFFIKDLDYFDDKIFGQRYEMGYSLDVHYFPGSGAKYSEIRKLIPKLSDALEYIHVIDPKTLHLFRMTGTKRRADVVDGVLHMIVTYETTFAKPVQEIPMMANLDSNQYLKTS